MSVLCLYLSVALSPSFAELPGLADSRWHVREQASQRLAAHGNYAYPALWCGSLHRDAEVRVRCLRARASLAHARCAAAEAGMRPADYPFLDSLWYDTAARRYCDNSPWCRLRPYITAPTLLEPGFSGLPYGRERQASRQWMRDGVAAGIPPTFYRLLFCELRRRDAVYLAGNMPGG